MGTGGFLSMGANYIAVPPSQLRLDLIHKVIFLETTQEHLKSAPSLPLAEWDDFYQSDRWREASRFFGESSPRDPPRMRRVSPVGNSFNLGYIQRATTLVGMSVRNKQDESVGSVENLIVDLAHQRVTLAIIASGGFLGVGDDLIAIPPSILSFDHEQDKLHLDVTDEMLKNSNHFTSANWPDFSQPHYASAVYQAFHIAPDSGTDRPLVEADNTARNARDRDNGTLTPINQSNALRDLQTTQQIRKAVMTEPELSVTARNVKIITINGRVTLRGPVRTTDEKHIIEGIAAHFTSNDDVVNQLDVISQEVSAR
jgi:hypothetical protein